MKAYFRFIQFLFGFSEKTEKGLEQVSAPLKHYKLVFKKIFHKIVVYRAKFGNEAQCTS